MAEKSSLERCLRVLRDANGRSRNIIWILHRPYWLCRGGEEATAKRDAGKFQAFRIDQAPLEIGDVVCRDRVNVDTGECYGTTFANVESGGHSHGEIVLEVNPQSGYAITIGGNTSQEYPNKGLGGNTCGKHKIRIDSRGVVTPQGKCAYFAVLKPPAQAVPESEAATFEYEVGSTMLPGLSSAKHDYSLRGIADGTHGRVPKEFLEAILVKAESDASNLTYRVFWHVNHPELLGKMLDPKDPKQTSLRFEWAKVLRTQVGPLIWLRQMIDQLDRHRGTIPRAYLLGWIALESDGQVGTTTGRGERGYFQVDWKAGEAKEQLGLTKSEFDRLSTDRTFSIAKGVELVQRYRKHILDKYPLVPDGSDLLFRLTKCRHAASGIFEKTLTNLVKSGTPITWSNVSSQVPGWMVKNVNAAMDYTAKLKPLANLVPVPAGSQPELYERNGTPYLGMGISRRKFSAGGSPGASSHPVPAEQVHWRIRSQARRFRGSLLWRASFTSGVIRDHGQADDRGE